MNNIMIANMNDNMSRHITADGWHSFINRKARRTAEWRARCTTLKRMRQEEMAWSQTKSKTKNR